MYEAPTLCPVCQHTLNITKLQCEKCSTIIEGTFKQCDFCLLPKEDLAFLKVFIKCRGNIKDVEKEMNISYPTVRSKLDSAIEKLGYKLEKTEEKANKDIEKEKSSIIERLSNGEISATEATRMLKEIK